MTCPKKKRLLPEHEAAIRLGGLKLGHFYTSSGGDRVFLIEYVKGRQASNGLWEGMYRVCYRVHQKSKLPKIPMLVIDRFTRDGEHCWASLVIRR